ncbi:MAG TPA: hypothetical protein VI278_18140 [Nitrososphaeraceae archaeon]
MVGDKDLLARETRSWDSFRYALREEKGALGIVLFSIAIKNGLYNDFFARY